MKGAYHFLRIAFYAAVPFFILSAVFVYGQEQEAGDPPEQLIVEETPQKVTRKAVNATTLPAKPMLRIPNYPDETKWYNSRDGVVVFWDVPDDALQVSLRVSKTQDEKGGERQSELFNGKNLEQFEEGVWYVRAQFRNNRGWGALAYHKVRIDRTPPVVSDIVFTQEGKDDPAPKIEFKAEDALSGISRVAIAVDGREIGESASVFFELPSQNAGAHTVSVIALDSAGNRAEKSYDFEVEPLPAPVIIFTTHSISEGDSLFVSGNALAGKTVTVTVYESGGREMLVSPVRTNTLGEWETVIKEELPAGSYTLLTQASDERGAISNLSDPVFFFVIPKSVVSIGGVIYLGVFELIMFVLLLGLAGIGGIMWYRASHKKSDEVYNLIAERDVELIMLLEKDLDSIEEWIEKNPDMKTKEKAEVGYLFKKTRDTVKKVKVYLGKEFKK